MTKKTQTASVEIIQPAGDGLQPTAIEIYLTREGIKQLIIDLEDLVSRPDSSSVHLNSETWGGEDLVSTPQRSTNWSADHLRIFVVDQLKE